MINDILLFHTACNVRGNARDTTDTLKLWVDRIKKKSFLKDPITHPFFLNYWLGQLLLFFDYVDVVSTKLLFRLRESFSYALS